MKFVSVSRRIPTSTELVKIFTAHLLVIVVWNVLGFSGGYIKWDDEDDENKNSRKGTLPTGVYNKDTTLYYCCREDGFPSNEIFLPTDTHFVLYRYKSNQCQAVHGMEVTQELAYWDTEDDDLANGSHGSVPSSVINKNLKLFYCYYSPKR